MIELSSQVYRLLIAHSAYDLLKVACCDDRTDECFVKARFQYRLLSKLSTNGCFTPTSAPYPPPPPSPYPPTHPSSIGSIHDITRTEKTNYLKNLHADTFCFHKAMQVT